MPRYTIRLNVAIGGKDPIVVDPPEDYRVGQTVTMSPKVPLIARGPQGGEVRIAPGVSISGQVVAKE